MTVPSRYGIGKPRLHGRVLGYAAVTSILVSLMTLSALILPRPYGLLLLLGLVSGGAFYSMSQIYQLREIQRLLLMHMGHLSDLLASTEQDQMRTVVMRHDRERLPRLD